MNKIVLRLVVAAALLCGGIGIAIAQRPVENVNPHRHPNLAAAQRFSEQAYQKVVAAQQANEFDLDGHAKKAKELLEKVNDELKQAAEAANRNHK